MPCRDWNAFYLCATAAVVTATGVDEYARAVAACWLTCCLDLGGGGGAPPPPPPPPPPRPDDPQHA